MIDPAVCGCNGGAGTGPMAPGYSSSVRCGSFLRWKLFGRYAHDDPLPSKNPEMGCGPRYRSKDQRIDQKAHIVVRDCDVR